jgi:4-hydroxyproline epimerase
MHRVRVIDSHTEGEPTRIVLSGGPELGSGSLAERRERFRTEFDSFRRAVVNEPRGSEVVIGGLLVPPIQPESAAGVIFFDNAGYLGMCGHGTIGLVTSLAHLDRWSMGTRPIETPVGVVQTTLLPDGRVTVENVASRCERRGVRLSVPGHGTISGDIAWGGNWFFLVDESPLELTRSNIPRLVEFTRQVHAAIQAAGLTGTNGEPIDHVELSGPPSQPTASGRNFVLCPGGMYDRSPCGTGTSAKVATLHAQGLLRPGQVWRQEGILGGIFEATLEERAGQLIPRITGSAHVTAEAELLLDERDPYCYGFPS